MKVIGQFADMDDPDAFVWLRGFGDMQARRRALTEFYDGPVWSEHRHTANSTMIDSDDVLLLHPAREGSDFQLPVVRAAIARPGPGIFKITTYKLKTPAENGFLDFYEAVLAPVLDIAGDRRCALLASEHSENSFTRLPVRLGENVLISISRFDSPAAQADFDRKLVGHKDFDRIQAELRGWLAAPLIVARLAPTAGSLLR